jgi:hypothetical protein
MKQIMLDCFKQIVKVIIKNKLFLFTHHVVPQMFDLLKNKNPSY